MNSRMDKYELETPELKKRTERNKKLYQSVDISDYDKFDINSNISVLKNNAREIDVNQIREMLDKKYRENIPQRKSIDLSDYEEPKFDKDPLEDTKEYDLNSILSKAKSEKKIDYDVERLNKSTLSLELVDKINEKYGKEKESSNEEELRELIDTITALELKNRKSDAELLGLSDDAPSESEANNAPAKKETEEEFYTGNLAVTEEDFDDFKDMQKDIKSNSIFIKILTFIFILIVIAAIIFIVNNIFNLGLFK